MPSTGLLDAPNIFVSFVFLFCCIWKLFNFNSGFNTAIPKDWKMSASLSGPPVFSHQKALLLTPGLTELQFVRTSQWLQTCTWHAWVALGFTSWLQRCGCTMVLRLA